MFLKVSKKSMYESEVGLEIAIVLATYDVTGNLKNILKPMFRFSDLISKKCLQLLSTKLPFINICKALEREPYPLHHRMYHHLLFFMFT